MIKQIREVIKKLLPDWIGEFLMQQKFLIKKAIKKRKDIISSPYISSIIKIGDKKHHSFFGYYDISPFNVDTNEIIYLKIKKKNLNCADIVLHDLSSGYIEKITTSYAWNWQQGSRLRWYPNSRDEIIFNDYRDGKYISRIVNIRNKQERIINKPIYDIDNKSKYALGLNFERLGVLRPGYGYTVKEYSPSNDLSDEGIELIDIKKNHFQTILTYKQIAESIGDNTTDFKNNYINHLSFSPSGDKFLFFWLTVVNHFHKAFLMVYDLKEKKITPLELNSKVSHYVWIDNNCILSTAYNKEYECGYYKYWLDGKKENVNQNSLKFDGHPSLVSQNLILTDTYPDSFGYQKILISNLDKDETNVILEVFNKYKLNNEERTDLHPRLNKNKNQICFDANIKGYRQIYILNYEPNCNNNNSLQQS